ncbi:MAG: hypothetical protein AB1742_11035 [bacterium]
MSVDIMKRYSSLLVLLSLFAGWMVFLTGCGGGGSSSTPVQPPEPDDSLYRIVYSTKNFSDYGYAIYAVDENSVVRQHIVSAGSADCCVSRKSVVYSVQTENYAGGNIMELNLFTGNQTLIASGRYEYPQWNKDCTKITFQQSIYGGFRIYVVNSDGTGMKTVDITQFSGYSSQVEWNSAGTSFFLHLTPPDIPIPSSCDYYYKVSLADMSLSPFLTGGNFCYLSFANSVQRAAYAEIEEGNDRFVHIMDEDGGNNSIVPAESIEAFTLQWSPDSRYLIAMGYYPYEGIYRVSADGSSPVNLKPAETGNAYEVIWSPDSTMVLFDDWTNKALYVMDSDGAQLRKINGSIRAVINAAWSQDSQKIAFFNTSDDNNRSIYLVNNDGTGQKKIADTTTESAWVDCIVDRQ